MKWESFLEDIKEATQVTLVGPFYKKLHKPKNPSIYIDGGAAYRNESLEIQFPTISVGDGDSAEGIELDKPLPQEKDYSDLAFVLDHLPKTVREVELLGFLGGRRDHELLNYGEVHHYLSEGTHFRTARFDDMIVAFAGGAIRLEIHGTFSVVVFEPSMVTIQGACTYPIEKPATIMPVSSVGLSNMAYGQVVIDSYKPCFVFLG